MGQQSERQPLRKLSKAASAAILERRLQGRFRVNRWLRVLKELAHYDEAGELLQAQATRRAAVSGSVLFFALIGVVFSIVLEGYLVAVAFAALVLVAVVLIPVFLVRSRRFRGLDLPDDFRTVLIPFLIAIREDIPKGHKIKLSLDLAGLTEAKKVRQRDLPPRNGKNRRETVYSDPWCRLEAPLALGGRMKLVIANVYARYDFRWRTSSAKHKRKSKWKKLVVVRAGLFPDPRRFVFDRAAVGEKRGSRNVSFGRRLEGEWAMMKAKRKFKVEGPEAPSESIRPKEIVAMFLAMGSMIRPVPTGGQPS